MRTTRALGLVATVPRVYRDRDRPRVRGGWCGKRLVFTDCRGRR